MDERIRRIGENEALYRNVNEKIEDLNSTFGMLAETMAVVCECGNLECTQQIELDVPTYERVRADGALFVIVPGHEILDVESVIEDHETFVIIRKVAGEPAALAEATDPRD